MEELKMKRNSDVDPKSRRGFLKDLAAAGGVAVAAAVASPAIAEPVPAETAKADGPDGYKVTDHVRTYYHKARI
jgi:hypothetical protein